MKRLGLLLLTILLSTPLALQDGDNLVSSELEYYYGILGRYDLPSDINSAHQFLVEMLPDNKTDSEIELLVKKLSSGEYAEREAAEKRLVQKGAKALGVLAKSAKQGDTETRLRSKRSINSISQSLPQIIEAAINILRLEPDQSVPDARRLQTLFAICDEMPGLEMYAETSHAIQTLAGPKVQDTIVSGIRSSNRDVRVACVTALPNCFTVEELKRFEDLLVDDDDEVAIVAIENFGEVKPSLSVKHLVEHLIRSNSTSVRQRAVNFLRSLSGKYLGLNASQPINTQSEALKYWENWLAKNQPVDSSMFKKLKMSNESIPIGFLVSMSGSRLYMHDFRGILKWSLAVPLYDAQSCSGNRILVTERNANQVRLIDRKGRTIKKVTDLNSPSDAELLPNHHFLILQGNGIVTEHDITGKEINRISGLNTPFDVDRLRNGNTLVADSGNDRIVEFDQSGNIVWQKAGLAFPNNVFRMRDGRTLYTTYSSGMVGLLTPKGDKIWEIEIEGATLYSIHYAASKIYVSDGRQRRIVVLDMSGKQLREIKLGVNSLCDVGFVTANNR